MSNTVDDKDNDISSEDNSQDELCDRITLQELPIEVNHLSINLLSYLFYLNIYCTL